MGIAGSRLERLVRESVRVSPAPWSHSPAWRASLTLLIGLATLAAVGHIELAVYACFGTFASIFGGRQPLRGRWRTQAATGAMMCAAVVGGALVATSSHRGWLVIPVTALVAALGSMASDRFVLRPPGPLFPVFAVATCAAVPVAPPGVVVAGGVAVAAATIAVLLGLLEERLLARGASVKPARGEFQLDRTAAVVAAVVIAGTVSTVLGLSHTYWAMVAAAVPFGVDGLLAQTTRGLQRVVGTVIGLVLAGLLLAASLPALATALVVAFLQAVTELLVGRHYGLALITITPLSLLMVQLGHPQPIEMLLWSRLAETLLGVVVGLTAALALRESRRRR
ncbi:fusaric acid resistance family protein [Nocardioides albertanoniae]|uniref:Fusaric acid resistance family protein n=1 Tax=Nocardioides albertanoniae TaxID=1175486 RepID=A0A543A9W5_9ACTN|nr:FUSC family protein [Nocardioides albertanoniae]TQL69404.1 fusaric acid resistance family protein [Nocardioides albertanoniae]